MPGIGPQCCAASVATFKTRVVVQPFFHDDGDDAHDERHVVRALQRPSLEGRPNVLCALNHEPQGNDHQDNADEECRQCLVFAAPVTVTFVRSFARESHHGIHQRIGHRVADAVDAVGKDGTRVPQQTGGDFHHRQADVAPDAHQGTPLLDAVALYEVIMC